MSFVDYLIIGISFCSVAKISDLFLKSDKKRMHNHKKQKNVMILFYDCIMLPENWHIFREKR